MAIQPLIWAKSLVEGDPREECLQVASCAAAQKREGGGAGGGGGGGCSLAREGFDDVFGLRRDQLTLPA